MVQCLSLVAILLRRLTRLLLTLQLLPPILLIKLSRTILVLVLTLLPWVHTGPLLLPIHSQVVSMLQLQAPIPLPLVHTLPLLVHTRQHHRPTSRLFQVLLCMAILMLIPLNPQTYILQCPVRPVALVHTT